MKAVENIQEESQNCQFRIWNFSDTKLFIYLHVSIGSHDISGWLHTVILTILYVHSKLHSTSWSYQNKM